MSKTLTLTRPDDWHLHVRDGAVLKDVLAHTSNQFARAVIMPNLKPPVTSVDLAKAVSKLFSTHPPIEERIETLRAMESLGPQQ